MSAQDHATVIRTLFEAFNRGDIDRAAASVTEDFELEDLAMGQTFRGPDGLRQWLGGFRRAAPDARAELTNLIVGEGEWAASEHVGRGTNTGPLAGPAGDVPPSGRAFELRIAEVYQLRGGRLARLRAYYDMATFMRQLGLIPPPDQAGR